MEQCPDYYLAEPSPGLPAAVAGLIANGFWRAGGHAQFSGGTGSDRWTDVRASGRGKFGLIFRVQPLAPVTV